MVTLASVEDDASKRFAAIGEDAERDSQEFEQALLVATEARTVEQRQAVSAAAVKIRKFREDLGNLGEDLGAEVSAEMPSGDS